MNIVKELKNIRREMHLLLAWEEISKDVEEDIPWTRIKLFNPKFPSETVKKLVGDEEIKASFYRTVHDAGSAERAKMYWNVHMLLAFDHDMREKICRILLDRFKELEVQPSPVWLNILKKPDFFDTWQAEIEDLKVTPGEPLDLLPEAEAAPQPAAPAPVVVPQE